SAKPQRSILLAVEAWKYASKGQRIGPLPLTAQEAIRKALSQIGGLGYSANQGMITRLAVSESDEGDVNWLAAASQDGAIALWEMGGAGKPAKLTRLSFGYKMPINSLLISHGKQRWLLAQSGLGNRVDIGTYLLTAWNLTSFGQRCQVTKVYQTMALSAS